MNTLESALARRATNEARRRELAALMPVGPVEPVEPNRRRGRPQTHGHEVAYRRHIEAGEQACGPCDEAHERAKDRMRERFHERKAEAS